MGHLSRSSFTRPSFGWTVVIALWATSAFGTWFWMTQYACSGSRVYQDPKLEQWPVDSVLAKSNERATLLLFLHPRCPCSVAVLNELQRVLACVNLSSTQRPKVILVCTVPTDATQDWFNTNTLRLAKQLPEVEVYWDVGGSEAQLFGATTSGTIRHYRADGELLFSGGITISRGQEGASHGGDALLAVLNQPNQPSDLHPPVFGCQLCIESAGECSTNGKSNNLALREGDIQ